MALSQELSDELTKFVIQQFSLLPDFTDDGTEISEYIVLLIANGRSAEETYNEVKDIVSNPGLQSVIISTYKALEDYQNRNSQVSTQTPAPVSSSASTSTPDQSSQTNGSSGDSIIAPAPSHSVTSKPIPSRPAAFANRTNNYQRGCNAISKARGNGLNKNFALRNTDAFQRALDLSNSNGSSTFIKKKNGRCRQFPHCQTRDCQFAHPTKPCFSFPNCPNPPGTCNYLHPGEDDALVAEFEKVKKEAHERKQNKYVQKAQNIAGITLCKFGTVCTNPQCPFGHPTPANEDNKVTVLEWCPANLTCQDTTCTKAHSSLSKIKEIKPVPSSTPAAAHATQEKSLDPCKFGMNCTNRFCKFRHATTPVMCREGASCTRIDCYFSHPINEVCRFGEGCKNPKCLFQHPNGKSEAVIQPKSLTWTKTDERQFAVPDSEVLEQAPPQEG